jgi:hypothetical protein
VANADDGIEASFVEWDVCVEAEFAVGLVDQTLDTEELGVLKPPKVGGQTPDSVASDHPLNKSLLIRACFASAISGVRTTPMRSFYDPADGQRRLAALRGDLGRLQALSIRIYRLLPSAENCVLLHWRLPGIARSSIEFRLEILLKLTHSLNCRRR